MLRRKTISISIRFKEQQYENSHDDTYLET